MKTKKMLPLFFLFVGMFIFMSMTFVHPTDWTVPAKYKTMKNPYVGKGDPDGVGKDLFNMHCKSCHGAEGYGDGKKAANLSTALRDFTSDEVQAQSDGEIYYKSFVGKDDMPNFEKKIANEQDRWMLVNYIRKLAK